VVGVGDVYDGRSIALADLSESRRARRDRRQPAGTAAALQEHVQPGRHWIDFDLDGTASNRSAIGARVELYWNGQMQVQEVSGGSGFSAENQRRLHYGLGNATAVDRWRSAGPPAASDDRSSGSRPAPPRDGAAMRANSAALPSSGTIARSGGLFSLLGNRLVPPIFITVILITAHLSFGILEDYTRTALAIASAIAAELVIARLTYGRGRIHRARTLPHQRRILVRSPFLWPFALAA